MARQNKDVFGFDELEKSFKKMHGKYVNASDAMLMAQGKAVQQKVKQLTPKYEGSQTSGRYAKKPGQLRRSWSLKSVKLYKGGKVRVVRIQSRAPHTHLVELGHEQVSGGKTRKKGRTLNRVQRTVRGIKSHGRVEGKLMLNKAMQEAQSRFNRQADKLLDKLVEEFNND